MSEGINNSPASTPFTDLTNFPTEAVGGYVTMSAGLDMAAEPLCFYSKLLQLSSYTRSIVNQQRKMLELWSNTEDNEWHFRKPLHGAPQKMRFSHSLGSVSRLERVVVGIKHQLVDRFYSPHYCSVPRSLDSAPTPSHYQPSSNCVTFEFFNISAPLIPGSFPVNLQLFVYAIDNEREKVVYVDRIGSFVTEVNGEKYGRRTHVFEYFIPTHRPGYEELLLVVKGNELETELAADERAKGIEAQVDEDACSMGNIGSTASEDLGPTASKCRPNMGVKSPAKRRNSTSLSSHSSGQQIGGTRKRMWGRGAEEEANTTRRKIRKNGGECKSRSGVQHVHDTKRHHPQQFKMGNSDDRPRRGAKTRQRWRVNGVKSVGQWYDTDDNEDAASSKELSPSMRTKKSKDFTANYGNSGIVLMERENGVEKRTSPPHGNKVGDLLDDYSQLSRLNQRAKDASKGVCSSLRVELSNEHGYGEKRATKRAAHARPRSHIGRHMSCCSTGCQDAAKIGGEPQSPTKEKPNKETRYQIVDAWRLEGQRTARCSPSSSGDLSTSSSSGYGSLASLESSTSPPSTRDRLNDLVSAQWPNVTDAELKCLLCDREFPNLLALMVHLNSSYPSFTFEYGRSGGRVIDVALKSDMAASRQKGGKEDFVLDRKFIRSWRWKLKRKLAGHVCDSNAASYPPSEVESGKALMEGGSFDGSSKSGASVVVLHSAKKPNYNDLFVDVLPFAGPSYTELANPPMPYLFGVDTNQCWLRELSSQRLDQFLDVSPPERGFFILWNGFVAMRSSRVAGCCRLPSLLHTFVEEFGSQLIDSKLTLSFLCHCIALEKQTLITTEEMFDALLHLRSLQHSVKKEPFPARRSPCKRSPASNK